MYLTNDCIGSADLRVFFCYRTLCVPVTVSVDVMSIYLTTLVAVVLFPFQCLAISYTVV